MGRIYPTWIPAPEVIAWRDVEREHVVAVLEETGWRVSGERPA